MIPKKKLAAKPYMFPKPAVLVGAMVKGKPNFNVIADCGVACYDEPTIMISSWDKHFTNVGIRNNKTFSVNIPSVKMAKKVDFCGLYSGKTEDKSSIFKVFYGDLKTAPMIEECPVCMECRVVKKLKFAEEEVFFGRIEAVYVSENCVNGDKLSAKKVDPLIYSTADKSYFGLGKAVGKAYNIGAKKKK